MLAYFELELPDGNVDPESNSNPFAFVWEIYELALRGGSENVSEEMAYAARQSYKTLLAAVLEILMVFHHKRDVIHLAAIESQSARAQKYVRTFLNRPLLADFVSGDNKRTINIIWYEGKGQWLTAAEYQSLAPEERHHYREQSFEIQIVVCTESGVQGPHGEFMCVTGDTEITVRNNDGTNRRRRTYRANGLYRLLAGIPNSGNWKKIPGIVNTPATKVEALSVNLRTGAAEWKPITAAVCKRSVVRSLGTGRGQLRVTPDHPLYVLGKGFVPAEEIVVGDCLLYLGRGLLDVEAAAASASGSQDGTVSDEQDRWDQMVLGSLLGDGALFVRAGNNPCFYENHCEEQREYLEWKRSYFAERVTTKLCKSTSGFSGAEQVGFRTGNSALFKRYENFKETFDGIERLDPLGLAVWYMDDGCATNGVRFSTEGFSAIQNAFLADFLARRFGVHVEVREYAKEGKTYYYLGGGVEAKRRLVELCSKYVHPTMAYKFDISGNVGKCVVCSRPFWYIDRGSAAKTCADGFCGAVNRGSLHGVAITQIQELAEDWVYDFTVADNHNFLANGFLSKNCVDEVDVIRNPQTYVDAKMIPSERVDRGQFPITVHISTRKSSFGLVQKEIDDAPDTGLVVRHWNILDVTARCPKDRHRPDLPRLPVYVDSSELRTISEAEFEELPAERRTPFQRYEAFAGCLSNCRLFAACRGYLATKQESTALSLKSVAATQLAFRRLGGNAQTANCQLLSRKPSSEGLVYPRLDPDVHCLTTAEAFEKLTGQPRSLSVEEFVRTLVNECGAHVAVGMDFGQSHNFAVTLAVIMKPWCVVFDGFQVAELELEQQIALCKERGVDTWDPDVWPDMAGKVYISSFRRNKFRMRTWKKGAGSLIAGIQILRGKARPTISEPELLFLADSPGAKLVFDQLSKYHFTKDAAGNWTEIPSEEDDDIPDSARYLIMNEFPITAQGIKAVPLADEQIVEHEPVITPQETFHERQRRYWEEVASVAGIGHVLPTTVKKGRFTFLT